MGRSVEILVHIRKSNEIMVLYDGDLKMAVVETYIPRWVYWYLLDANCLVLVYYTFFTTCFGCIIHPSSGASYNAHAV